MIWDKTCAADAVAKMMAAIGGRLERRWIFESIENWRIEVSMQIVTTKSSHSRIVPLIHVGLSPMESLLQRFENPNFLNPKYKRWHTVSASLPIGTFDKEPNINWYRIDANNFVVELKRIGTITAEEALPAARKLCSTRSLLDAYREGRISRDYVRTAVLSAYEGKIEESRKYFSLAREQPSNWMLKELESATMLQVLKEA